MSPSVKDETSQNLAKRIFETLACLAFAIVLAGAII